MERYMAGFREVRIAAGTMILRGHSWIRETESGRHIAIVEVQATVPPSDRDGTIEILRVVWGELTGHDALEVARVAEVEAYRFLRETRLVTKDQLMAVNDWHLECCDDQTGCLASPSLKVRIAFSLTGRPDDIYGCAVKSGGRYILFYLLRRRKWAEQIIRRTLVRLAMQAPKTPGAADGELDEVA